MKERVIIGARTLGLGLKPAGGQINTQNGLYSHIPRILPQPFYFAYDNKGIPFLTLSLSIYVSIYLSIYVYIYIQIHIYIYPFLSLIIGYDRASTNLKDGEDSKLNELNGFSRN